MKSVKYQVEARYKGGKWSEWNAPAGKSFAKKSLNRVIATSEKGDGFEFRLVRITTTKEILP